MRSFVADGNFKAVHLKQKNDTSDVWLTSGEGFMTDTTRYGMHLDIAEETKTVCFPPRRYANHIGTHDPIDSYLSSASGPTQR
jgi:hypothetical protein